LIVLAIAWFYQQFGRLPAVEAMLHGISPVVVAIVAQALWKFAGTALKTKLAIAVFAGAVALHIAGFSELGIITLAALIGLLLGWLNSKQHKRNMPPPPTSCPEGARARGGESGTEGVSSPPLAGGAASNSTTKLPVLLLVAAPTVFSNKVAGLFLVFLKIGSVIYGSGYVLLAFLRADLVERLQWMSERQLLDAVAVGQMTPGPVFTTATFIGYHIAGVPGALAATLGIFIPSFVFVGLLAVLIEKVKHSPLLRSFLDAVNAASLALMAVVTWQLAVHALMPEKVFLPLSLVLALASLVVLFTTKINSAWLILVGALCGWFFL
jgi:chromate transporter